MLSLAQVVDFHWNPAEPFTLMSVADDSALDKGGGTLQLWRISDLITRPEEEVLAELEPHRHAPCALTDSWFPRSNAYISPRLRYRVGP